MAALFTNNATTTLAAGITSTATTLNVASSGGALFPAITGANYFVVTLVDTSGNSEIVRVTARSGDTFTIARAQEGTTARAFAGGDKLELRPTAASLNQMMTKDDGAFSGQSVYVNTDKMYMRHDGAAGYVHSSVGPLTLAANNTDVLTLSTATSVTALTALTTTLNLTAGGTTVGISSTGMTVSGAVNALGGVSAPNNQSFILTDTAGSQPYLTCSPDNNVTFYSTNASGAARPVWSISARDSSASLNLWTPVVAKQNVKREGAGPHLYHNNPSYTSGRVFVTFEGVADPTSNPGDLWLVLAS